jgi:hypothetical protein
MLRLGFEPKIPAFELAKMVYALDREATVIGRNACTVLENKCCYNQRSERKDDIKTEYISHSNLPAMPSAARGELC